jgi:Phosphotransferase enzyme family
VDDLFDAHGVTALDPWSPEARVERLSRVLHDSGLSDGSAPERLESYSTDAWVVGDAVLRICWLGDRGRLSREGLLVDSLPAGVPYPHVIARGETAGLTWLATRRLPGKNLDDVWGRLSPSSRRRTVGQLAEIIRCLHEWVPSSELASLISVRQQGADDVPDSIVGSDLVPLPIRRALRLAPAAAALPNVDPGLCDEAARQIADLGSVDPFEREPRTVVHGDLHLANVLWDETGITALLDFEWSRFAPPDFDLVVLVCTAEHKRVLGVDAAEAEVLRGLRRAYPALFAHPQLSERLRLYALASALRDVMTWPLTKPEAEVTPAHPIRQLRRLVANPGAFDALLSDLVG